MPIDTTSNPISLEEDPKSFEPIDLHTYTNTNRIPNEVARNRARKYDYALGDTSPGQDVLEASINNGTEHEQRQQALLQDQIASRKQRIQVMQEIMNKSGGHVTPEQFDMLRTMSAAESIEALQNPENFFEKKYAQKSLSDALKGGSWQEAEAEQPGLAHAMADVYEKHTQQAEGFKRITEDAEAQYNKENLGIRILAKAESWMPFWNWSSVAFADKDAPRTGILKGTILEDQYTHILGMEPDRAIATAKSTFDEIYANDKLGAIDWLRGLTQYSQSSKFLDNAFSVMDAASLVPITKLPAGAAKLSRALKYMTMATAGRTFKPEVIKIVGGEAKKAAQDIAINKAATKIETKAENVPQMGSFADLTGELGTFMNPHTIYGNDPAAMVSEQVQRHITDMETSRNNLLTTIEDPLQINRLTPEKRAEADRLARLNFNAQYPHLEDNIHGIDVVNGFDTPFGVDMLGIRVGKKDGSLFTSEGSANAARNRLKLKDAAVAKQFGDNQWYLQVLKPIDETDPVVRSVPLETGYKTPRSMFNTFLGYLRSGADLVGPKLHQDMLATAYGSSAMLKQIEQAAKPLAGMRNVKEFNDFMQWQRVQRNPKTGKPGVFSNTQGDLERDYFDFVGRHPTEKETAAYWSFRQLNDYSYMTYNLSLLRDKLRKGFERFHLSWHDPAFKPERAEGEPITAKHLIFTPPLSQTDGIEGKFIRGGVDGIPWDNPETTKILVMDRDTTKWYTVNKKFSGPEKLKEKLGDGEWQLIQLTPEGKRAIRKEPGFGSHLPDDDFNFVLTKEYKTTPLQWQQIPYQPGGRIELKKGFMVRQPRVKPVYHENTLTHHYYDGDSNILHHESESDARAAAEAMEKGRQLINEAHADDDHFLTFGGGRLPGMEYQPVRHNPREQALYDHLQNTLPWELDEFLELFKTKYNPGGQLDLNTPITYTPMDRSVEAFHKISDKYANMIDSRKSSYNLFTDVNLSRALEKNDPIWTFTKTGDPELPIFNQHEAAMIDPIATINRSAVSLMRGRYLDDLKFKMGENFIAEFSHVLSDSLGDMRKNPLKALLEGKFKQGVDRADLAAAKNFRRVALNFLGLKNDFQKNTQWAKQKLADVIYKTTGQQSKIVEQVLLTNEKDPVTFFRSVAFHSFLGLYSPAQVFMQAQTVAHVAAVEGLPRAYDGLTAAMFMKSLAINADPKIVASAAKRASKISRFTPEEFIESWEALKDSGFYNVGKEYSARGGLFDEQNVVKQGAQQFIHKGTIFFEWGESLSRFTAWNAAYKRWRAANPTAKFGNNEALEVLDRADLLNVNMSIASHAAWNHGWASVPTQFANYQVRLAEQFAGKRLTWAEKAHAGAVYAGLYGLPVAAGIPTAVWPWYEDIRQTLLEKGVDYDENVLTKGLTDGILSMMTEAATGEKYNVGSKFGPGGSQLAKEIWTGEKGLVETLLGASGTSLGNFWASAEPLLYSWINVVKGEPGAISTSTRELENFARNISSVNAAYKWYYAANLGKYISKNGTEIDQLTGVEGFVSALTGLTKQSTDDIFRMTESNKERADAVTNARKEFSKNMRWHFQALKDGDDTGAAAFYRTAHLWAVAADIQPHQEASWIHDILTGNDMALSVAKTFTKDNPARLQNYMKLLGKREGTE